MVFDCIVRATGEKIGDFFPAISDLGMCVEEGLFFLGVPGFFGDVGRELVVPSDWGAGYLYRICLEDLEVGIFFFISAAMRVH